MIPANVQADWEGLGAAIIATIVVLVFGIGVWRNIRRRRRERAAAAEAGRRAAEVEESADADRGGGRRRRAASETSRTRHPTPTRRARGLPTAIATDPRGIRKRTRRRPAPATRRSRVTD